MSKIETYQVPVLEDNYVYLLHDAEIGVTAVVDPAVVEPVLDAADFKGWKITHILNTHHHGDHTGGNIEIKKRTDCTIVGSRNDKSRIPGIDIEVGDGDTYFLGNAKAQIFDVSGHTQGHIAYWFEESHSLFCGDTIFAMGCGRLIEGSPAQMWEALSKLTALPDETLIYCGHEYTEANGNFALTVEPENTDLLARMKQVRSMRRNGIPTVPSTMAVERTTNPFLRPDSVELQKTIGLIGAEAVEVFAETRARKDRH